VAAGERPTVERIRAHLGTGSPNTIAPLLGRWWNALGDRLFGTRATLDLPEAPTSVRTLAGELWAQALLAAQEHAEGAVAQAREALVAEQDAFIAERARIEAELDTLRAVAADAQHARALAEERLTDAVRLSDQQGAQLTDMQRQRDALDLRCIQSDQALDDLRAKLEAQSVAAAEERDAHLEHLRATENRAHTEIDRAREDAKRLQRQLDQFERDRRAEVADLRAQVLAAQHAQRQADTRAAASQAELATVRAQSQVLHRQLARALKAPATKPRAGARAAPTKGRPTSHPTRRAKARTAP
jgi:hypothetical protein